jgi:tripartite-type tricarboxylate transporter receptor subunit TctC
VKTPEFDRRMQAIGNQPWAMSPAELTTYIPSERERLGKIIREANIKVE